jgi:hypothetical protein
MNADQIRQLEQTLGSFQNRLADCFERNETRTSLGV